MKWWVWRVSSCDIWDFVRLVCDDTYVLHQGREEPFLTIGTLATVLTFERGPGTNMTVDSL